MTSPEYRETHNLPRKLSLRAQDLTDHASEQGRERYADRPDIRAAMEAGRHDRNLPAATRSSQETALRPLVRAARKRGGQGKQASAQQRMDVAAQQLGFDTLTAYLNARQGVTASAMARELGVPRSTLGHWLNLWASTAQPGR
jgi:hypothetical protein